jgi:hypothetical protein
MFYFGRGNWGGSVNSEQKAIVWRGLLESDQAARYWRAKALAYIRNEKKGKIILAIMSAATVVLWRFYPQEQWLWQASSIFSALIAAALPILDLPRHAESMIELNESWTQQMNDYEELWSMRATEDDAVVKEKLRLLKAKEVPLAKKSAKLPNDDEKLGKKTYYQVLEGRGIESHSEQGATT